MQPVLILNIDYTPLQVVSWRTAIEKLFLGKVEAVETYAGRFIRSPSLVFPHPAVVRLVTGYARRRVRMSRRNVLARDQYMCQYCGYQPVRRSGVARLDWLTIDHVVPRAQARDGWVVVPWSGARVRVTSWTNVVAACAPCNQGKGNRTPGQARMKMRRRPKQPSPLDIALMGVIRHAIPTEWRDYLPRDLPRQAVREVA